MGINMCFDASSLATYDTETILQQLENHGQGLQLTNELVLPILRVLFEKSSKSNVCVGTFIGEDLKGEGGAPSLRLEDLRATGCDTLPLDPTKSYTVVSFGLPPSILDAAGICSVADPASDKIASLCLAYSCEDGVTIASALSGAALGCFAGNPGLDATTEGLSEIAGEAVELGVEQVGMGLSLNGGFVKELSLWGKDDDYDAAPFSLNGNFYAFIEVSDESLPAPIRDLVELTGVVYQFFQIGDGSASADVQALFRSRSPLNDVRMSSSLSTALHGEIDISLKLDEIEPKGLLAPMELGSAVSIDALVSTQNNGRLDAGLHLHMGSNLDDMVVKAFQWVLDSIGDILDKIVGKSGFGDKVLDCIKSIASNPDASGSHQFGLYLTEAAFGLLFEFPPGDIISSFLPPFIPFPSGALGTIKIKCHHDIVGKSVGCGVNYGEPKWIAAIWKDIDGVVQKVYGDVKNTFDDATADAARVATTVGNDVVVVAKKVVNTVEHTVVPVVHQVVHVVKKDANTVNHAFTGGRRRRRFTFRRRRRGGRRRRRRL